MTIPIKTTRPTRIKCAIRRRSTGQWLQKWAAYRGFIFQDAPRPMPLSSCKASINLMAKLIGHYPEAEVNALVSDLEIVEVIMTAGAVRAAPSGVAETIETEKRVTLETRPVSKDVLVQRKRTKWGTP